MMTKQTPRSPKAGELGRASDKVDDARKVQLQIEVALEVLREQREVLRALAER